jgi:FixJ family two-component response regulator
MLAPLSTGKRHVVSKTKPLIAIVDDDESVCRAMKRLVRSLGMNAETFTSGNEFMDLIEAMPSFDPDCVVLDVQMPGMNGLEVQERVALSRSSLPVIFITAHDEVGARERALAMGAVAFLRKPFNDELFSKTLNAALERTGKDDVEDKQKPESNKDKSGGGTLKRKLLIVFTVILNSSVAFDLDCCCLLWSLFGRM